MKVECPSCSHIIEITVETDKATGTCSKCGLEVSVMKTEPVDCIVEITGLKAELSGLSDLALFDEIKDIDTGTLIFDEQVEIADMLFEKTNKMFSSGDDKLEFTRYLHSMRETWEAIYVLAHCEYRLEE